MRNRAKTGRQRRRRAKTAVDFATGGVRDRALDAGAGAETDARALAQAQGTAERGTAPGELLSPEELSHADRAQFGTDAMPSGRRSRIASEDARQRWVKARKIP